jgi:hypothetical protein
MSTPLRKSIRKIMIRDIMRDHMYANIPWSETVDALEALCKPRNLSEEKIGKLLGNEHGESLLVEEINLILDINKWIDESRDIWEEDK